MAKPRSALVIQANQFDEHTTVTVLLISSTLVEVTLTSAAMALGKNLRIELTAGASK